MTDADRLGRNAVMLRQCHPVLASRIGRLLMAMSADGYRPRIQQAYRSPDDQETAYRSGHSRVRWGFHCAQTSAGAPEALACDILDDDHPLAPPPAYLLHLAAHARAQQLLTGILWGLSPTAAHAVDVAIAAGLWDWPHPLGWDPTHCQPADLTIAQARTGLRPEVTP